MIKRFLKEIIIFTLVSGISRFLPFLLIPLFSHYIRPEQMGRLELILSVYNVLMIFGICQIDTALQRYYYDNSSFSATAVHQVAKLSFCISILIIVCSVLVCILDENNGLAFNIVIAALSMFFGNIFVINNIVIRYSKPITYVILTNISQTVSFAIIAYYCVVILRLEIRGYIVAMLLSNVLACSISLLIVKNSITLNYEKLNGKLLFDFALPQLPARIASALAQYGNRFILLLVFNQSLVGLFSVANKISSMLLLVLNAFSMVWYPMLYSVKNRDYSELIKIFKFVIVAMTIAMPVFAGIVIFIFNHYIDRSYHAAKYISIILLYTTSFLIIKEMVDAGIKISRKVKFISYIYVSITTLLFITIPLFGHVWGLEGAVYAMFFSNILLTVLTWLIANRCYPLGFSLSYVIFYIIYTCSSLIFIKNCI